MRLPSSFLLALFTCVCAPAFAGPVTGRVVDPDGRIMPGVQVLVLAGGPALDSTVTNARGEFTIASPDGGRFELRLALDGFRARPLVVDGAAAARDVGTLTMAVSAFSESLVVSAAHVEIPLSQASASVTIVTGAEIEARQTTSVADVLRTVPGMAVATTGSAGAVTGVFPRGGESNFTLLFVDGIQANAFGGEMDFAHLATANVDRVEVVRGPQSALYGSNAIGSVVRVVTRRGGRPAASGTIEGGSFGTMRTTAATSGSRAGFEWGGSAEHLSSDGMNGRRTSSGQTVANDDYTRRSGSVSAGWRGSGGRALRMQLHTGRNERGFPGPFGTNPIGAFTDIDTVSRGRDENWLASAAGTLPMGARVRTHAHATLARQDTLFDSPFGGSESSSRRSTARVQSDAALARRVEVSAGVEVQRERAAGTFITAGRSRQVPVERTVAGYFAEGRWSARERFFVTVGARADHIRRDALDADPDAFAPRPAFPADTIISVNPKISAAWFVRPSAGGFTKIRASAGTGIRPPGAFDIAFTDNPSLEPERSVSAEAGIDQALADGRGLLEATAFVNNYDDLIVAVGSFRGASQYRTDNISNARARGVELAGTLRTRVAALSRLGVHVRAAYTFIDTEILAVDRSSGAPPPFAIGDPLLRRPRHQLTGNLVLTTGRWSAYLQGGGRGRMLDVEPSLGTFGGLFYSAGYSVWNTGATFRVHRSAAVFGRVDNLFGRAYEEALGFPALGRGAVAGLRIAAGR